MKQRIVFALIMGIITTGLISFTIVTVNIGFRINFLSLWLRSWSIAYLVVVPVIVIVGPKVQVLTNKLFKEKQ